MSAWTDDDDDDGDFDDPLLRRLAAAPPIPLGEPQLPADTLVAQNYRVHRMIGAGSMGVVYEATDLVLSRRIALKVHEIGRSDRAARLWREARTMARLSHPNVVTVFEVGVDGSRGYIAMELVEGTNARVWRRAADRSWRDVLDVYRQAGAGLAAAHDVGIVHRDFKPDNVLIGTDRRVRVADFGIALPLEHRVEETTETEHVTGDATRTGVTMGTPAYMAPEQMRRERADARSDQYSFCVALKEALETVAVPTWIAAVIERGLARDPSARHPDMHSLVAALDPAPRGRRRAWWMVLAGASLGGVALLRLGGWLATDEREPCRDAGTAIDGAWSPDRAAALQQAFTTHSPLLADATTAIVVPALDAWTATWRDAARDACEATRVRGEQSESRLDQRMDCLERARRRLVAVVDLLTEADPTTMARADAVARSLPDVQMCARSDAAVDVHPDGLDRGQDWERLSAALDRAVADAAAGHSAEAKAKLDELVPELEGAGFLREVAEARQVRAAALLDMGRRSDAIEDAAQATTLAIGFGDRDAMARAMLELARATGRTTVGFEEASRWLAAARALADDLDWSPARHEDLLAVELEIDFFSEQYAEVERVAAELLRDVPAESSVRIRAMSLLATTRERQGRFEEALAMHDEAVALVERLRGPDHPQTAMVLGNRVHSLSMLARKDEARSSLNRVLAIRRAVFGPDAPVVGEAHRQIGDAERASGNLDAAATQFEEALAIHRRAQDDVGTFFDLANFGEMRLEQGQTAEAARFMDEALTHGERAFGADSLRVAQLLVNRSGISVADGQPAAAVAQIERALAIFGAELPADDLTTGVARLALGRAYVLSGRADEGLASFEDGARIVLAKFPQRHPQRVALARAHAELLVEAKRPEAALARLREAAGIADEILAADDAERGGVWEDLAARLEAAGRGREASAARERARAASP